MEIKTYSLLEMFSLHAFSNFLFIETAKTTE